MKIQFDGKHYDTACAVKISTRPGADSHQELMQTPDGDYFLLVHRVLLEREKAPVPNGHTTRFTRHEEIVPLTPLQALEWCLKSHIPKDLYRYLPDYLKYQQAVI